MAKIELTPREYGLLINQVMEEGFVWALTYDSEVFLRYIVGVPGEYCNSTELPNWIRSHPLEADAIQRWKTFLEQFEAHLSKVQPPTPLPKFHRWYEKAVRAMILGIGDLRRGHVRGADKSWSEGKRCLIWAREGLTTSPYHDGLLESIQLSSLVTNGPDSDTLLNLAIEYGSDRQPLEPGLKRSA